MTFGMEIEVQGQVSKLAECSGAWLDKEIAV